MVDIEGVRCLVVGGGRVAERKVRSLIGANADVILISPEATPSLMSWATQGQIKWRRRPYQPTDHDDCRLVFAATDQKSINEQIYQEANKRGQWVNIVDQPELGNFTVPATVKRGKLTIAISTSGASPSVAQALRCQLEEMVGEEYELYLDLLQEMRGMIQQQVPAPSERARLMKELAKDHWLEECRVNPAQTRGKMHRWLEQALSAQT